MFEATIDSVSRDLREVAAAGPLGWLVIAGLFLLPLLSVGLIAMGSRLAIAPLSIFVALLAETTLYYETGYRDDLGAAPSALILLLALLMGWMLLGLAAWRRWRRRIAAPTTAALDPGA